MGRKESNQTNKQADERNFCPLYQDTHVSPHWWKFSRLFLNSGFLGYLASKILNQADYNSSSDLFSVYFKTNWPFKVEIDMLFITASFKIQRTSDSLNEGLPIKMTKEKFHKENDIFSMKKIVASTLDLSTKAVFSLDNYQLKNMGWKLCFCHTTYRK